VYFAFKGKKVKIVHFIQRHLQYWTARRFTTSEVAADWHWL